ncbi:MAG: DUF305 domain-containing protein [Actinomycetota bacterium]|nr:DUF305 domain-containing protein [Actinomycetota bacterium]
MRLKVIAATIAAGALALAGCGGSDTQPAANAGHDGHPASSQTAAAKQGNGVDRGFVAEMIPHHESAVQMAKTARTRGESRFVKRLAGDIVRTQNAEITTMQKRDKALAAAGVKRGSLGVPSHMTGMDDDPAALKQANPFDREFLSMMIPHHEGAVTMAKAEIAKGGDAELKQLAQAIIKGQEREIREMRAHLGEEAGATGTASEHH